MSGPDNHLKEDKSMLIARIICVVLALFYGTSPALAASPVVNETVAIVDAYAPANQARLCNLHAKYDASTNGSTSIVTGIAGRKVYICGVLIQVGSTATNVKIVEGTGTNCGTGAADITPAYQLPASGGTGFWAPFWTGVASATNGDDVCINASAGNAVQADLSYTIQ